MSSVFYGMDSFVCAAILKCLTTKVFAELRNPTAVDAALLDAEWAVFYEKRKKKKGDLRLKFQESILLAGRRGLTHLQALAAERLALYMEETGDNVEALYRYEQAVQLYEEWGAKAKVGQLQPKIDVMDRKGIPRSSYSVRG